MLKNRNFLQKSNFTQKHLVKNPNFRQKLKFLVKNSKIEPNIEILVQNQRLLGKTICNCVLGLFLPKGLLVVYLAQILQLCPNKLRTDLRNNRVGQYQVPPQFDDYGLKRRFVTKDLQKSPVDPQRRNKNCGSLWESGSLKRYC